MTNSLRKELQVSESPPSLADEIRAAKLPSPALARAIREAAGVPQARVAEALHVHRLTISRWESGERHPRGANRAAYAALLSELRGVGA
jgi:DNA-binding transcriptional regulator YiaG